LYSKVLEKPDLRFNYSLPTSVDKLIRRGLKNSGPYDSNLFQKNRIKTAIIFHPKQEKNVVRLKNAVSGGLSIFKGFSETFRTNIDFVDFKATDFSLKSYDSCLNLIVREDFDLCYIIFDSIDYRMYSQVKTKLLGNGIPCQVINHNKIDVPDNQLQWIIENVALASYAKVGGTPWVIHSVEEKPEIVIGVSRAMDRSRNVIVGFTTVFKHNGDFILFHSKSPVIGWDKYQEGLGILIREAIEEYTKREKKPSSVVFHFHKNPGVREIDVIEKEIKELDIEFAMLHLNSYANFRIFDTTHNTCVPLSGLQANLSRHSALLISDGRLETQRRPYLGIPSVLEITMNKNSTMEVEEFPRLVSQIYDFAHINWRGFNAKTVPVTINYSYLIARLIANLESTDSWNSIITNGKLIDKAWFL
jgi:hypothetical protein